ncbi:voltage-gated shaker-like K+ channel [Aspergillus oryzae 100-8]|uniref:Voltage-gated shaker-like K+ channel, subunit beta/KCNAB n=1 Tax=Aspergillus oryzae (strain 3.042) TaxID=1160506 RepID=I8TFU8_ASPO3|nr:voltage-gated shaker-like K+ channel, subunit beta/KCNAB [Aspergillus oryzae 3.042]KDE84759.1 voltage-gated shaker-like K+ channel [Aspergillus oryzae 100-8]|eukprot:EIT72900.1 voltage-gated shaker-like K+ channel, subunit beta/KCNAB [Aspergillus oryzae 3.042]
MTHDRGRRWHEYDLPYPCPILSSTAGIRVSPLQLGGMSIGEKWNSMLGSMDKESSFKLLDAYFEAGGNFIDTANLYQDEQSEISLGEWMASRQNRDQIVIGTKFTSNYNSHELGKGKTPNFGGNHRKSIQLSVMDTLHMMVEQGKVLYLGISMAPAWVVSAADTYAQAHAKTPFCIYQGRWNVMVRDLEREIIPVARHFGMAIAPWEVVGSGKFQTKKAMISRGQAGEGLRTMFGPGKQNGKEKEVSEALAKVASEHSIESVTAIALAYVIAKAPNVIPLVGGRKVEYLHDNIQALSIKLTEDQIEVNSGA